MSSEVLDPPAVASSATRAGHQPQAPIRVLVVDDHPAVRWGLVRLLEDQPDLEVAVVATNAEAAVGDAEPEGVEVAVVDYQLGGRNGLWVTRRLKAMSRPPRVVIFSAFASDHLAASCVVAGVDALLSKSSLGDELCNAIRGVSRGRRMLPRVPPAMADMLRRRLDDYDQVVFGMLLAGIPEREIESALGMDERELATRKGAMLAKLEALPGEPIGGSARTAGR